ncbi:MAG: T9SS type A sorting domain-containing protein [Bacteroidales bacterium]|nr:T9SS type A sorting domain-containing protein [Bacteroidales bacterium]
MKKLLRIGLVLTLISTQFIYAQVVEIPQEIGYITGFTFVSTRIDMTDQDMEVVFDDYLGDLEYVKNSLGQKLVEIGGNWVNNIGDWVTTEGYLVKSYAPHTLTLSGQVIDVTTPITCDDIIYVSYLPFDDLDAEVAFATIKDDDLNYVKDSRGYMLRKIGPNWVNGIGDCIPGDGYLVSRESEEDLIYPWNCGDAFTDSRDDKVYLTVQIGDQCWMAENLNVGTRIDVDTDQTDNSTIEKYCYDDIEDSCDVYGGLYQWNEIMQYVTTSGTQGICPSGWHIPTDTEWLTLENEVETVTTITANSWNWRGDDVGENLKEKTDTHWNTDYGQDTRGFTALPGGQSWNTGSGSFGHEGTWGKFYTSDRNPEDLTKVFVRSLKDVEDGSERTAVSKLEGRSLRCIKDAEETKSSKRSKNSKPRLSPKHFIVEFGDPSQDIWTIFFDKGEFEIGDEIGVYFGETLAGAGVIQSDSILDNSIPVFSNLYKVGMTPTIKVWDKSLEKEFVINNFSCANPYGNAYTRKAFPKGDMEYTLINSAKFEKSSTIEMENEITISPNPSEGIFNISINNHSGNIQLIITNMQGKACRNFKMSENSTQFDLSDLTPGVYFVRCIGENFNTVKKVVIK